MIDRADCPEFDETGVGAGFAARPIVAHRECGDAIGIFDQNRIAQTLRMRFAHLGGQVEAGAKRLGHVPACTQRLVTLHAGQRTKA